MTHWKLTISYDGTEFCGWQVQPDKPTVQGCLRAAIAHVTGETVLPQGSGRTDAGVHALAQVVTFGLNVAIPPGNLLRALNRALPMSVRVLAAEVVPEEFHARHSAVRKSYEYRILCREMGEGTSDDELVDSPLIVSPFVARYVWACRWPLVLEPMQRAASMVCGTHDFTSFAATDPDMQERENGGSGPNPVKTIYASAWKRENGMLVYRVTGSGFLHHMVRNLVGTMVDVGRGAMVAEDMQRVLEARDRKAAGPTAPAQGLFLVSVEYPEMRGEG